MQQPHCYAMLATLALWMLWNSILQFNLYRPAPDIRTQQLIDIQTDMQELADAAIPVNPYSSYYFKSRIRYNSGQHHLFTIHSNSCIKSVWINGTSITIPTPHPTPGYPRPCHGPGRINLDLSSYLYQGQNLLYTEVVPTRGENLLSVRANYDPMRAWCYTLLWLYILGIALTWFIYRFHIDLTTAVACLIVLFLCLLQFMSADFVDRSNDLRGHMYYIRYVMDRFALPAPTTPQMQQPPLYYLLSAIVVHTSDALGIARAGMALKAFSLGLFIVFIAFGVLTLRRVFTPGSVGYYMALGIFLFWPHHFIMATKVNNDALLYCLGAAILYYLTVWQQERTSQWLALVVILCGLSVMTKSSGLLFCAITGFMVLYHLARRSISFRYLLTPSFVSACTVFTVCAAANFGRTLYHNITTGMKVDMLSIPTLVGTSFGVPNKLEYFTQINMGSFLTQPFMSAFSPSREYFWNYLFKTLLFGEWTDWQQPGIALLLATLLLVMAAAIILLIAYLLVKRTLQTDHLILPIITIVIMVIGLMYFRYSVPAAPSNNARYIYNMILPLGWLYGYLCQHLMRPQCTTRYPVLSIVSIAIGVAFILASITFEAANSWYGFGTLIQAFRFGSHVI
jgi:hypothetical protein